MWSGGAEEGNYYCDNTLNYHNLTIDNQPSTHFTSSTNTKGLIDWKTCISIFIFPGSQHSFTSSPQHAAAARTAANNKLKILSY